MGLDLRPAQNCYQDSCTAAFSSWRTETATAGSWSRAASGNTRHHRWQLGTRPAEMRFGSCVWLTSSRRYLAGARATQLPTQASRRAAGRTYSTEFCTRTHLRALTVFGRRRHRSPIYTPARHPGACSLTLSYAECCKPSWSCSP